MLSSKLLFLFMCVADVFCDCLNQPLLQHFLFLDKRVLEFIECFFDCVLQTIISDNRYTFTFFCTKNSW